MAKLVLDALRAGYQLVVHGKGGFREIIITNGSGWPDYVFDSSYKLMSLNDLELFIAKNGHLPDISSAKDIDSNSGYNLHTNNVQLLKKIEELTLYIIALNKEIDLLKKLK
ncbi:MAG: hypothetical protein IPO27_12360 [Bacteroidetes bacterium]|nr:hypothetical protein [Bacteroidota bacterium]